MSRTLVRCGHDCCTCVNLPTFWPFFTGVRTESFDICFHAFNAHACICLEGFTEIRGYSETYTTLCAGAV